MSERPSMREILEAARRGSPSPPKDDSAEPLAPPTDAETPKKPLSMAEKLAAARGTAPQPTETPKKPLSMAEKLAAARGTAPQPTETTVEKTVAAPPVPPPPPEVAATRGLADELRRAGARKDEEAASRPPVEPPVGVRLPFSPPASSGAATAVEPPSRSQIHVDHRGVLVFASWAAIGWAALAVAIALTAWTMVGFLFPGADATP